MSATIQVLKHDYGKARVSLVAIRKAIREVRAANGAAAKPAAKPRASVPPRKA